MAGHAASIELTATEVSQLQAWVRAGTTPQRLARRARLILASAAGLGSGALAKQEPNHGPSLADPFPGRSLGRTPGSPA